MIVAPPGEPTARNGLPSARDDRRAPSSCAGACRPSALFGCVGGVEVEVGQLVVEQEAVAGHDDAVAAGRLDRERVGHDRALAVGDHEVGGRRLRLGSRAATGLVPACSGSISARRSAAKRLGEQARERARRRRSGSARNALRSANDRREASRNRCRARVRSARRGRIALEDVERLADRRAAARGRAHAPDVEAAIADRGWARARGPCRREVAPRSAGPVARRGRRRRAIGGRRRGVDDRVGDRARGRTRPRRRGRCGA